MGSTGANDLAFVIAAYAAAWITILGYLLYLRGTLRRSREAFERAGGKR